MGNASRASVIDFDFRGYEASDEKLFNLPYNKHNLRFHRAINDFKHFPSASNVFGVLGVKL